mmetsp:Transcript_13023/g.42433  ORF Transcript_13023/g.42433 Transcript_13023/m.42433 type:complete len:138 (-) Transcript_13023:1906-2319(-)
MVRVVALVLWSLGVSAFSPQRGASSQRGRRLWSSLSISVTERANAHIAKQTEASGELVRLGVKQGGCGKEFSYTVAYASEAEDGDVVSPLKAFSVVVAEENVSIFDGVVMDWNGEKFTFVNPNAKHSCDCGNSFSTT